MTHAREGLSDPWRVPFWARLKLAVAVLRGRQWWGSGYPTPWAYEQVCEALRKERERRPTYDRLGTPYGESTAGRC